MKNPRLLWLWFFIIVNCVASLIVLSSGEYIGELAGVKLYSESELLWATLIVIGSYLIMLGPVFWLTSKIKVSSVYFGLNDDKIGKRLGLFLIILQILYAIFNLTLGLNIAGSNNTREDSQLNMLWVMIPVDTLFMIYYAQYRNSKFFYLNLAIWLISNILRGWTGVFLFVIFMETTRVLRKKKILLFHISLIGILMIAIYPILLNFKWIIRADIEDVKIAHELIINNIADYGYILLIEDGITNIIARLQSVIMLADVIRLSDVLQSKFMDGEFAPFWMEGLHGIIIDKLFYDQKSMYIGVAFTSIENFAWEFEVGDWNVSLGYASWFFIAPILAPLYLVFTVILGFFSIYLMKKINYSKSAEDLLWFTWLVYLLAPWIAVFVAFIYALLVFFILKLFFSK